MVWYLTLKFGLLLARVMPRRACIFLWGNAFSAGRLFSPGRASVAANLQTVAAAGGPSRRPSEVYTHYGRYWGEWLAALSAPRGRKRPKIRVEGGRHLELAAIRGPVCVLTAHLGAFDLLGHWLSRHLPEFTAVVEEVKPRYMFNLFQKMRHQGGSKTLVAEGQGRRLFRVLREGGSICLLSDRVFGAGSGNGKGRRAAPFVGGYRYFPSAGMDLARRAGASLVPIFMLRENDSHGEDAYVIKIYPPLAVEGDPVSAYARCLEREILARPEQWSVLYPLHDAEGIPASGEQARAKGVAAQ